MKQYLYIFIDNYLLEVMHAKRKIFIETYELCILIIGPSIL